MNIFEMTYDALTQSFSEKFGKGAYHSTAVYREIFQRGNLSFESAPEFEKSKQLSEKIQSELLVALPEVIDTVSEDNTIKFLCRYPDGLVSESVIIKMKTRNTLCLSSQIGCRMHCRFCETGRNGFQRNLQTAEITGQLYCARFILNHHIENIVFMGMGEPLDNFDNVVRAIAVISDPKGFNIAHRRITLSTAGLPEAITRFAAIGWYKINLALSLNASDNQTRSWLMPINNTYNMEHLKTVLDAYPLRKKGAFLIEYVLIRGINDTVADANRLGHYLATLPVRFNLIPLNKTTGFPYESTTDEEIHRFGSLLEQRGLFVTKRWSKGRNLSAACGQLGKIYNLNSP